MPSIKVFGSNSTSINSEEITKLPPEISFKIPDTQEIPEVITDLQFYSPKTYRHEQYIFKDLE